MFAIRFLNFCCFYFLTLQFQLGQLLTCDWALETRTNVWEQKYGESSEMSRVNSEVLLGFKNNLLCLRRITQNVSVSYRTNDNNIYVFSQSVINIRFARFFDDRVLCLEYFYTKLLLGWWLEPLPIEPNNFWKTVYVKGRKRVPLFAVEKVRRCYAGFEPLRNFYFCFVSPLPSISLQINRRKKADANESTQLRCIWHADICPNLYCRYPANAPACWQKLWNRLKRSAIKND